MSRRERASRSVRLNDVMPAGEKHAVDGVKQVHRSQDKRLLIRFCAPRGWFEWLRWMSVRAAQVKVDKYTAIESLSKVLRVPVCHNLEGLEADGVLVPSCS